MIRSGFLAGSTLLALAWGGGLASPQVLHGSGDPGGGGLSGDPGSRAVPADTVRVASNPLEAAALAFADALADLSGDRMGRVLVPGGIRLQLDGAGRTGLSARQAAASLRDFVQGYDAGEAFVTRTAPVEGSLDRGFAEVLWSGRVSGTSQEVHRTLFLGFDRGSGEWRVDEVRVLR